MSVRLDAARLRVPLGFLLAVSAVVFLRPSAPALLRTGLIITFVGLLIRAWAAGCIKKAQELATSGPYAIVRHPLYLGSSLMAGGFALAVTSPHQPFLSIVVWGIVVGYFVSVYSRTIAKEERHLADKFSSAWTDYKSLTPALIPYRTALFKKAFHSSYSIRQYLKNKEYQAAIGWLAVFAWLLAVAGPKLAL